MQLTSKNERSVVAFLYYFSFMNRLTRACISVSKETSMSEIKLGKSSSFAARLRPLMSDSLIYFAIKNISWIVNACSLSVFSYFYSRTYARIAVFFFA